jgi:RNA polymerase sigma-70 factor (ECF subfamily)
MRSVDLVRGVLAGDCSGIAAFAFSRLTGSFTYRIISRRIPPLEDNILTGTFHEDWKETARMNSERDLAKRLKDGETMALHELYAATFAPLYRFVYFQVQGDHEVAQEIVHDAFLEAVRSIASYLPDKGSLQAWLCGIARNRLRALRRERDSERKAVRSLAVARPAEQAVHEAEKLDTLALINATLSLLPNTYSDVLIQKYVKDKSVREIAKATRQTEKAIESLLSRARAAFRESYTAEGESHD